MAWFKEIIDAKVALVNEEQKFFIHPGYHWLGCTPDGISGADILEIKCPAKPPKELPEDWYMRYMPQVQGQMEIVGADYCYLVAYHEEGVKTWEIERSKEYFEWMFPKLEEFWSYVQKDKEPPRTRKEEFEGQLNVKVIYE